MLVLALLYGTLNGISKMIACGFLFFIFVEESFEMSLKCGFISQS